MAKALSMHPRALRRRLESEGTAYKDLLADVFEQIAKGAATSSKGKGTMIIGVDTLPELPTDPGDRNRTSPFAFTGNKFEFRALGSSMSLGFVNTILNTIVAEAVEQMTASVEEAVAGGTDREAAILDAVKAAWSSNKEVVFDGDGYSEAWHKEAEERGLLNLPTTPDALPWFVEEQTVAVFEHFGVLTERELEARFEVAVEQYSTKLNIEAEVAASMARTQLLPAGLRHLALFDDAEIDVLEDETEALVKDFVKAIFALEKANAEHPADEGLELAKYMRDVVIPAMDDTREVADKLERIVADDLWPLPKYSEMLFIK